MSQQTFIVGGRSRIVVARVNGSISVLPWERREISIELAGVAQELRQEGDVITLTGVDGDITVLVPAVRRFASDRLKGMTAIGVTQLSGHASVEGARSVSLKEIGGSVHVKECAGDVELTDIHELAEVVRCGGDLRVVGVPKLLGRQGIGGDAAIRDSAQVELDAVGGDLALAGLETAVVSSVGGDVSAQNIGVALRVTNIGSDCRVQESAQAEVHLGSIGGDANLSGATSVHVGNIGGDVKCTAIAGQLHIANVGGDARLREVGGVVEVSNVGGDLDLAALFPTGSQSRFRAGGDAVIRLADNPNLSIQARVGGDISGASIPSRRHGNFVTLVYGAGAAALELSIGGDLKLHSSSTPESHGNGEEWSNFGRDMANFGREMGNLGRDISRQVVSAVNESVQPRDRSDTAQARATILRMVAEGRISSEDGDLLLQGLRN